MDTENSRHLFVSKRLTLREDDYELPDGSAGRYWVVEAPDIALVIPADGDRLHLVEQYRHPLGRRCWEFPSGTADADLDVWITEVAARELREETGLVADTLAPLGSLDLMPSTLAQRCHVFLATDLTAGPPEREPDEQDMRAEWFTRDDVERMITDGTITDAKTIAAYGLLLTRGEGA